MGRSGLPGSAGQFPDLRICERLRDTHRSHGCHVAGAPQEVDSADRRGKTRDRARADAVSPTRRPPASKRSRSCSAAAAGSRTRTSRTSRRILGMTAEELDGVATFYNLIYRRPVGRHVILMCDSVSCWIMGYDRMRACAKKSLGIAPGETTADGRFTLLPVPCLGTCDKAPAMMVGRRPAHRTSTPEKFDADSRARTSSRRARHNDGETAHKKHPARPSRSIGSKATSRPAAISPCARRWAR